MLEKKEKKRYESLGKILIFILFLGIVYFVIVTIPNTQNQITTIRDVGKSAKTDVQTEAVQVENDTGQSRDKPKQSGSNKKTIVKDKGVKNKSISRKSKEINVVRDVRLREKPDNEAKILHVAKKGEKLQFIKEAGYGWLKVKYRGKKAFVYYYFTDYNNPCEKTVYYKKQEFKGGKTSNVRGKAIKDLKLLASPGINSEVVDKVEKDTSFSVLEHEQIAKDETHGWFKINVKTKKRGKTEGYVYAKNVDIGIVVESESGQEQKSGYNSEIEPTKTEEPKSDYSSEIEPTRTEEETEAKNTSKSKGKKSSKKKIYTITAQKCINLYKKENTNSKILKSIQKGDKLKCIETTNGWLKTTYKGVEGFVYYLYTDYAKIAKKETVQKKKYKESKDAFVNGNSVNLRTDPGITTHIKDCLSKGTRLKVLSYNELIEKEKYGWFKVKVTSTGEVGFMYGEYVKISKQGELKPVKKTKPSSSKKEEVFEGHGEEVASATEPEKKNGYVGKGGVKKSDKILQEPEPKAKSKPKSKIAIYKEYAKKICKEKYGWGDYQFKYLEKLWQRESGWNPKSGNKNRAYGIPQANPGTKMQSFGNMDDYKVQIRWGCSYIKGRYGTPKAAWNHSESHNPHWY